jgi:hypothetical protein
LTLVSCNTDSGLSKRQAWVERYLLESRSSFATRVAAYVIYYSIFNTAAATMLMHLASPKIENGRDRPMPGLIHGLAKVDVDHSRYVKFGKVILSHCVNKVPTPVFQAMLNEAVKIEKELAADLLASVGGATTGTAAATSASMSLAICGYDVVGANMAARIEVVADKLMSLMGYSSLFGSNSFPKEKEAMRWIDDVIETEVRKDEPIIEQTKKTPSKSQTAPGNVQSAFR